MRRKWLGYILVGVVTAGLAAWGYLTFLKKSQPVNQPFSQDDPDHWPVHSNAEIGFSFSYPVDWKVEDSLNKLDFCCLTLFSSAEPYRDGALRAGVTKAEFQYQVNEMIGNKQQYFDNLLAGNRLSDTQSPIDQNKIGSSFNKNNLEIFGFDGGAIAKGYVIPVSQDFSRTIFITVWNPDPVFETVLSTFRLETQN